MWIRELQCLIWNKLMKEALSVVEYLIYVYSLNFLWSFLIFYKVFTDRFQLPVLVLIC